MNATIESIKRKARILSRSEGSGHRVALDRIARAAGHSHWGSYMAAVLRDTEGRPRAHIGIEPPILVGALLDRPEVTALAVNEDGRIWSRSRTDWNPVPEGLVETVAEIRELVISIPHAGPKGFFSVLGADIRMAALVDGPRFSAVMRTPARSRGPTTLRPMDLAATSWRLDVAHGSAIPDMRSAFDHAIRSRDPSHLRIVLIDCPELEAEAPNHWSASCDPHDGGLVSNIAMRSEADAMIVRVDDEASARLAIDLAMFQNGTVPVVAVVDHEDGGSFLRRFVPPRERTDADHSDRIRTIVAS